MSPSNVRDNDRASADYSADVRFDRQHAEEEIAAAAELLKAACEWLEREGWLNRS